MIKKIKIIFLPCQENNYRPKFLEGRILFYYAILILVLKLSLFSFFLYLPKSVFFAAIIKSALLELANQTRKASQLPLLKENPRLTQAAYLKAKDMVEKKYFSHQSPEGKWLVDWLKSVDYQYALAGENLAIGFLDSEEVHQAWLNSSSHRANLLNPKYQEIGIAVLKGEFDGSETTVVVQLFGAPKILTKEIETSEKLPKTTGQSGVLPPEISPSQPPASLPPESLSTKVVPLEVSYFVGLEKSKESFSFRFLKFISIYYDDFVQKFVYGSLFFVFLLLLINIFVRIDIQHKDIIFKTLFFIGLLIFFLWLDKEVMVQLIPHQLLIY